MRPRSCRVHLPARHGEPHNQYIRECHLFHTRYNTGSDPMSVNEINAEITEKIATKEIIAKDIAERERLLSENLLEIKDRNANNISQHI